LHFHRFGLEPKAKILGFQDSAQDPVDWPTSPGKGIEILLERSKLTKDDISLWEINEAFAMVVLANASILRLDLVRFKFLNIL
jgi:acetyl-CoA C-acetyltransferase